MLYGGGTVSRNCKILFKLKTELRDSEMTSLHENN